MQSYGWRIPFVLASIGTLFAVLLRTKLEETPLWLMAKSENRLVKPSADTPSYYQIPLWYGDDAGFVLVYRQCLFDDLSAFTPILGIQFLMSIPV